jgi:hypothetical protein
MINGISPALYGLDPGLWSAAPSRRESSTATDLLALQNSSETTAEIGITTKDGDTVTISLASEIEAGYAYYRRTGPDSEIEARALVASASQELQITVQGNLDKQELADITKLVRQLGQAIRSFVRGDTTASAQQALDVKARDSLSGFTLDMEHSDSLTLIRASAETKTGPAGTVMFEEPGAQPTPGLPSVDGAPPPPPDITGVLKGIRKDVKDSGIDLARAGGLLVKALQRLLQRIAEEPAGRSARPALEEISARLPEHLHRVND